MQHSPQRSTIRSTAWPRRAAQIGSMSPSCSRSGKGQEKRKQAQLFGLGGDKRQGKQAAAGHRAVCTRCRSADAVRVGCPVHAPAPRLAREAVPGGERRARQQAVPSNAVGRQQQGQSGLQDRARARAHNRAKSREQSPYNGASEPCIQGGPPGNSLGKGPADAITPRTRAGASRQARSGLPALRPWRRLPRARPARPGR